MELTTTIFHRNGHYGIEETHERFDTGPIGLNKLYAAVMRRVMEFERLVQNTQDPRTDYHQDVLAGVAKPTNRQDYFRHNIDHDERYGMRDSASGRPPASHADNAGSIPAFRTADI